MELPSKLRAAVERALEGVALGDLKRAAETLSRRYRAELRDGALHLGDAAAARAYLATRLPATYATIRESLDRVAALRPDFSPQRLLDVGAGPGTALFAASDCWPGLARATLVETSAPIRALGEALARETGLSPIEWRAADATRGLRDVEPADLATLAYVLDELAPEDGLTLVERLWSLTADMLVIVEPGTPAGWRRVLAARERLIALGAHVVAPCPHDKPCPLVEPDWCHFARRVARSRLHRLSKGGEVPWEDEKYIFVAVSRRPALPIAARVLSTPKRGSGKVALKLCAQDGSMREALVTRRDGTLFARARRAAWGDAMSPSGAGLEDEPAARR